MSDYHQPVLLEACIEGLNIKAQGTYVDLTFGGGGHSRAIIEKLGAGGQLIAFDQDPEAAKNAESIDFEGFRLVQANFQYLKRYLRFYGISQVDGILADFGVSSHQIDSAERGFSTRFQGLLDMRMDSENNPKTARQILNDYSEKALHRILGVYGEVRNAKTLANALVRARAKQSLDSVEDLRQVASQYAPKAKLNKYLAQVFQALRIEVNQELRVIEEMLPQAAEVLAPKGRLVLLSYHSLEDRLAKTFIQKGKFKGEAKRDLYGNVFKPLEPINRKAIVANAEEVAHNPRARSAKLRIAERNEQDYLVE